MVLISSKSEPEKKERQLKRGKNRAVKDEGRTLKFQILKPSVFYLIFYKINIYVQLVFHAIDHSKSNSLILT